MDNSYNSCFKDGKVEVQRLPCLRLSNRGKILTQDNLLPKSGLEKVAASIIHLVFQAAIHLLSQVTNGRKRCPVPERTEKRKILSGGIGQIIVSNTTMS